MADLLTTPRVALHQCFVAAMITALIAFAGYQSMPLIASVWHGTRAASPTRALAAAPRIARPADESDLAAAPAPERTDVAERPIDAALVHAIPAATGTTFSPSFAPNGSALLFHTGNTADATSALAAADLQGLQPHVRTILDDGARNYHVRPSPDGSRIAFDSDRDGQRGVYVADRNGRNARRVSGVGFAALPAWSPDGRTLAFVRGDNERPSVWNLWLLDLATRNMRQITEYRYGQTWSASWFPDGRRIAYSHEDRLVIRDLSSGTTRELPSPVPHRLVRTPAVSPDGAQVIFQVSGSGAWLLDVASSAMRFVLPDATAEEFAWSPDGTRVAFHSLRGGQPRIWVSPLVR